MFNDVEDDIHYDRQQRSVHSPPGRQKHASSAKPNNAFYNVSPSRSPLQEEMRHGYNDPYIKKKQMLLSPKSSQQQQRAHHHHPSKQNGSLQNERYVESCFQFETC